MFIPEIGVIRYKKGTNIFYQRSSHSGENWHSLCVLSLKCGSTRKSFQIKLLLEYHLAQFVYFGMNPFVVTDLQMNDNMAIAVK